MSSFVASLYLAFRDFAEPLPRRLGSVEAFEYLCARYGWDLSLDQALFTQLKAALALEAPLERLVTVADAVEAQLDASPQAEVSAQDLAALIEVAGSLIDGIARFSRPSFAGIAPPLDSEAFWISLAEHLLDDLLEEYLRLYQPPLYLVLRSGGVIRYEHETPAEPHRLPYLHIVFDWDQIAALFDDPVRALKEVYHWDGAGNQPFAYERLVENLAAVLKALRVATATFSPAARALIRNLPQQTGFRVQPDVDALRATFLDAFSPRDKVVYQAGAELFAAAAGSDPVASGLVLAPVLRGGASSEVPLGGDFTLKWAVAANADDVVGVAIFPGSVTLVGGDLMVGTSLELARATTEPLLLFGTPNSARMELSAPSLRFAVEGEVDALDVQLSAGGKGRVVIPLDGADAFVQGQVGGSAIDFSFEPELRWSSKTGFTVNGKPKLEVTLPLAIGIGPVTLTDAKLSVQADDAVPSAWLGQVGVGLKGKLGPVGFVIEGMGARLRVRHRTRAEITARGADARPPALGPLDLDLQFAPPTGIGVAIEAAIVTGGGYIGHVGDEYSGALSLAVGDIAVKAYGVLQTKLPGGAHGYSFVVALSAEFAPALQLPFGFSLDGIGGLVGINRTISIDAVETALWGHHLDGLLFPKDPVTTAPQLVAALDSYFPAAKGRYLMGPLLKLGWGNDIVKGELALLLEIPEPLKILLIGEIQMAVPAAKPQLEVHISFAGGVDFGKKLVFFDASIHDSRIESYPISGDMAFRYGWGDDGVFALALGGFHPAFQPPASFPSLKRLAISIASSVAQLEARSYFALTANTLQFGARVELTAGTGSFNVHGWLGFDALCERHPLAFTIDLSAGVELRHHTSVLASVHLDGELSGPNPWHISGEASLSLFFFDVTVHFDKTWGSIVAALPLPDPLALVLAALSERSSYSGALPPGVQALVSFAGAPDSAEEAVLVDPAATLRVAQRVLPLGQPVTRFAGAALGRTVQVSIDNVAADGHPIDQPKPTSEQFAPAQFFEFSDAQKLSLPSFGRFAGGIEVGADAVDLGRSARSRAVITPLVYDTTIVDAPRAKRPGNAYLLDAALQVAMGRSASPPGRAIDRYAPPAGTRTRFDLRPDRWVVAGVADLVQRGDVAADGSKLGTQLALQQFFAEHPEQRGQWQVVQVEEAA